MPECWSVDVNRRKCSAIRHLCHASYCQEQTTIRVDGIVPTMTVAVHLRATGLCCPARPSDGAVAFSTSTRARVLSALSGGGAVAAGHARPHARARRRPGERALAMVRIRLTRFVSRPIGRVLAQQSHEISIALAFPVFPFSNAPLTGSF